MKNSLCWGIFREAAHSPGRESDDAEILRLTGKHLEAKGLQVVLKTPEEVGAADEGLPRFVFLMCERVDVLRRLRVLEAAGVPHVKRADVHNTQEGDVVLAPNADAVAASLRGLAARGIARAVLQPHVDGDLVKFYGIGAGGGPHGEPPWFRWFYHKEQTLAGHRFDERRLARLVRGAAAALGLEVYGGDAIVTRDGAIVLLDVNAWPSFALFRDEAAPRIAAHLALRFLGGRR